MNPGKRYHPVGLEKNTWSPLINDPLSCSFPKFNAIAQIDLLQKFKRNIYCLGFAPRSIYLVLIDGLE